MVLLAPTAARNPFLARERAHRRCSPTPTRAATAEPVIPSFSKLSLESSPIVSGVTPQKDSIAVIGAGTAGIGALIGLQAVPEEVRKDWTVELFERREDVGGVWFPDYTVSWKHHSPS